VDFIKVLDFGLVKHQRPDAAGDGAEELTAAQMSPGGTPAYMSPEQALGEGQLDARTDLYAVGCVAYWLLTGALVFKGVTAMETLVMHVSREPSRPHGGPPVRFRRTWTRSCSRAWPRIPRLVPRPQMSSPSGWGGRESVRCGPGSRR
jgi:serine/threonine protein kinase